MSTLKKANPLAVVTVTYPAAISYFDDLLSSLFRQTVQVPVIMFNDAMDDSVITVALQQLPLGSRIIDLPTGMTIAENRSYMLEKLVALEYDWYLFVDADDAITVNRVEKTMQFIDGNADILYNEPVTFQGDRYFELPLPEYVESPEEIYRYNFMGLSCMSIRRTAVEKALAYLALGRKCIAYDWFLTSILLELGSKALLLKECNTLYRLHGTNMAGDLYLDDTKYLYERRVKKIHYQALGELKPIYRTLLTEMEYAGETIDFCREAYIQFVNRGKRFWWDKIDDLKTYSAFIEEDGCEI